MAKKLRSKKLSKMEQQIAEERRLRRNERVRIRRAKARAAKRAGNGKERRGIPRRQADMPAPITPKPHVALVIYADHIDVLTDGAPCVSAEFTPAEAKSVADYIDQMQALVQRLGATTQIHDLRAPR